MTGPSLRERTLAGVRWTVAARLGLQLVTWPVTIIVMRWLQPADYGILALAMILIGFLGQFNDLGLRAGIVQASVVDAAFIRAASGAIVLLNLALALLLVVLAPAIASWFGEPALVLVIRVLSLDLLITACSEVPLALLERQLRFRELSITVMVANVCASACTLTAAWAGLGVWALVIGVLSLTLVRSVMIVAYHGGIVWPRFTGIGAALGHMSGFSRHVVGSRALWYWYGQADRAILGRMLHEFLLGNYAVAAQLAMMPVEKAMEALNKVSLPALSRLREDPQMLRDTYRRLLGLIGVYAIAVCWGLAAIAPDFVALALGAKWRLAATPLMLLSLVAPMRMICAFQNTVATAVGVPQAATRELAFAGVVVPLAILAGASLGGLDGAAIGWVVAYPLVYLLSTTLTTAAVGLRAVDGLLPLRWPCAAGACMFGAVWLVRGQFAPGGALGLAVATEIAVGAIAFPLALWILGPAHLRETRALILELARPGRHAA